MKKRILAILLAAAMLLTFMPAMALAEDGGSTSVKYVPREAVGEADEYRLEFEEGQGDYYELPNDKIIINGDEYICIAEENRSGFFKGNEAIYERYNYYFKYFDKNNKEVDIYKCGPGQYIVKLYLEDKNTEEEILSDAITTVTVTENPVESITYAPSKTSYGISEINKYKQEWAYEGITDYYYELPVNVGDRLGVKYKGQTSIVYYTAEYLDLGNGQKEVIFKDGENYFGPSYLFYNSEKAIEGSEAGNVYKFEVYYRARSCEVPITVTLLSEAEKTAAAAAAKAAELAAASNINKGTVTAADIKKASALGATTVTLGPKVKKIKKNAFKGTKITTIVVKTKKLKKGSVKGSLKGSRVSTVKVEIGSKKVNKKFVKKYKKFFTKKNAGKKAKVK